MKVAFTDEAGTDLAAIGDYIRQRNPGRATQFLRELLRSCRELGSKPEAFPLVPRYEERGIRRRVYGNYLIFYRVSVRAIEVIRVLHGARDYEALLFPDS
jgi:toxin ParE1/3/4